MTEQFWNGLRIRAPKRAYSLLACALVLPFAVAASVLPSPAAEVITPGTYREVGAATARLLAIGNELVIVNDRLERPRFSLNAVRPSDSHLGYVAGVLAHANGAQTWTSTRQSARCRLTFTPLVRGKLKVRQDLRFGDCGFGYGVTASGTYVRTRATGKLGPWNGP